MRLLGVSIVVVCTVVVSVLNVYSATEDEIVVQYNELYFENKDLEMLLYDMEDIQEQISDLECEIPELFGDRLDWSYELEDIDAAEDTEGYNNVVDTLNDLSMSIMQEIDDLNQLLGERDDMSAEVTKYISKFLKFESEFNAWYKDLDWDDLLEEDKYKYEELKENVEVMQSAISEETIGVIVQGAGIVVDSRLNDMLSVKMLVDTGSTFTVLPESIASILEIDYGSEQRPVDLTIADGSTIKAEFALLDSLKVGEMELRNVPVAIVGDDAGVGRLCVLGMSYLKHFYFSLDTNANELILRSYKSE